MVGTVMDQLHNLQLETVQEMGFLWEIDRATAKSIMVEFLRLRLIIGDNLSKTLRTWHADNDASLEELIRDLDAATQTSIAFPSKHAAVQAAIHRYREAAKLKLALPLVQLDAAQEEAEQFMQDCLQELLSGQDTK